VQYEGVKAPRIQGSKNSHPHDDAFDKAIFAAVADGGEPIHFVNWWDESPWDEVRVALLEELDGQLVAA